jgi:nucleoid-associated protein YgaU
LAKSRKALLAAHGSIEKGEMEPAKKSAQEAKLLAEQAYTETLPKLYAEKLKETEALVVKARDANAEEFASSELNQSEALLKNAKNAKDNDPAAAIEALEESEAMAQAAFLKSQGQSSTVAEELNVLKDLIVKAEQVKASEAAPEKLTEARSLHSQGMTALNQTRLKAASEIAKQGIESANDAIIAGKLYWAQSRLDEARVFQKQAIDQLTEFTSKVPDSVLFAENKETDFHTAFKMANETLDAGSEAITTASTSLAEDQPDESYQLSSEAIRIFGLVDGQIPALEQELAAYKEPEPTVTVAERSLDKAELPEGWKTYTVKYRKRNTDCLWRISSYKSIYNDAKLWPKIYKANMKIIKNPDIIFPGQVFKIPPKDYTEDDVNNVEQESLDKTNEDEKVLKPEEISPGQSAGKDLIDQVENLENQENDEAKSSQDTGQ